MRVLVVEDDAGTDLVDKRAAAAEDVAVAVCGMGAECCRRKLRKP